MAAGTWNNIMKKKEKEMIGKLFIASYYRQLSVNIEIKNFKI